MGAKRARAVDDMRAAEGPVEAGHYIENLGLRARGAARRLAAAATEEKNVAIEAMARALEEDTPAILAANGKDVGRARSEGMAEALIDRLTLTEERLAAVAAGLRQVAALPDPVGESVERRVLPNGLEVGQVRVPLGVIGIIYESRPNVTADAAALCVKAGNAVILRGGRDALQSNTAIARSLARGLAAAGLPEEAVQLVERPDRETATALMQARGLVDVLIPRGGPGLIAGVVEHAKVPVIETGMGVCHTYVDAAADVEQALAIVHNAKVQRPSVCNAMETLLVDRDAPEDFLPRAAAALQQSGVRLRGCEETRRRLAEAAGGTGSFVDTASEDDWAAEYLDLTLAIRIVGGLDEALGHIARYGTGHSEAIVTRDYGRARRFTQEVDAAAVYVNASTRFTDGFEFGLGAEIGISTQKLHARGPMGLAALTSTKFVVLGDGHVRP